MQKIFALLCMLIPTILFAQLTGNSLQIKDHGNCVSIPDSLSTSLNNDMTLEAWVFYNCENGTGPRSVISKGACGSTASYMLNLIGGAIRFTKWRNVSWSTTNCSSYSQVIYQTLPKTVPYNSWSHIAVSIDDTVVRFYLNGVFVPINTMVGTNVPGFKPSTRPIVIGAFDAQLNNYTSIFANIDDVRIWHKAKTQAEVQSEMNVELSGNEPDLFAYWKLNETGSGAGLVVQNSALNTGAGYNGITIGSNANVFFVHTDSLPNSISNCDPLLWLKADKGVIYNANKEVGTWQDQGQLGNHVSMSTTSKKPMFKNNEINNKPIVRFDGIDDYLATTNIDLTTVNKIEIFYVTKPRKEGYIVTHNNDPSVPNAFSIIENYSNGTNGHSAVLNGNGTAQATCKTTITDSCYHTMNVQFDKALTGLNQVKVYRDQTQLNNTNGTITGAEMTNALSNAPLFIGGSSLSTLPYYSGDIAEIIVYNKILTASERNQVYTYLTQKYYGNYESTQFTNGTTISAFSDAITDDDAWRHAYNSSQPNQVLTSVESNCLTFDNRYDSVFVEANAVAYNGGYFMRRHFVINPQTEYNGTKTVRLYYTLSDFNNLQSFNPALINHTQLSVTQYSGLNEDGIFDPTGGNVSYINPGQINNGSAYGMYYLEFQVSHFSEFWITASNTPLPVQDLKLAVVTKNESHYLTWECLGDCQQIINYKILQSEDASHFSIVNRIPAKGQQQVYQSVVREGLTDKQYFMIEATDLDNRTYKSNVFAVNNTHDLKIEIHQSPTRVNIFTNSEWVKIAVYNFYGQRILSSDKNLTIDKQTLSPGLYFARVLEHGVIQRTVKFEVN